MKPAESFERFYQSELLPHLTELEVKRKATVSKLNQAILLTVLAVLAAGVAMVAFTRQPVAAVVPVIVGAIVFVFIYGRITQGYVSEFKGSIVDRIVKFVNPNLVYRPDEFIPQSTYWQSGIFRTSPDRYVGEDMVRGMVGQTAIQFSEIHSEYKTETTDSKGNREEQWHTIFQGIFFVADFNKHFHGHTVVLPDVAERVFGRLGQTIQSWNRSHSGELVKLEDVYFEKRFVVYGDQVETRYILSPGLMRRIMAYQDRTGRDIYLAFLSSCIYVAISTRKNSFEPKLFRPVLNITVAQEYLDDLLMVVGIVEDLNLNTRIWTKA